MFGSATTRIREAVQAFALGFDPSRLDVDTAKRMVREWGTIENSAAAMKSLAAAVVADGGRWDRTDGKSAADWLAAETGTTAPKAQQQIQAGRRMSALDETAGAAKRGELSSEQAAAIADAASADPTAERALLQTAKRGSLRDLRDRCAKTKARADADPDATRRRIHAGRRVREWTDAEGVGHLHASGPVDLLARVRIALRPIADKLFTAARREGRLEDPAAYAFDALIELADDATAGHVTVPPAGPAEPKDSPVTVTGETTGACGEPTEPVGSPDADDDAGSVAADDDLEQQATRPTPAPATLPPPEDVSRRRRRSVPLRFRAVIRVDYEALIRGRVEGEETCEIAGVGPVPVRTARDLLGEATLHLVITKGVDVANVTYLGRSPNAAQRLALLWQTPMCIAAGCARRARLQYDHGVPFADSPETRLDNLRPFCEHHHSLKTNAGWDLVAGSGRRPMVPPEHPDHPKNRRVPEPSASDAA